MFETMEKQLLRTRILFFVAVSAAAQTVSSIQADGITHSSARVSFQLSSATATYLKYGKTTGYGHRTHEIVAATAPVHQITGMAPGTTYHWAVTRASDDVALSADQTLTTSADVPHPVYALPPVLTAIEAPPAVFANTYNVAADCSNLQNSINTAAAQDGNLHHRVLLAAGTVCLGTYILPAKTGSNPNGSGFVVITSDSPQLPPPGVRISPAFQPFLAVIRGSSTTVAPIGTAANAKGYWLMGLEVTPNSTSVVHLAELIRTSSNATASSIVIDRCYLHGWEPPAGTMRGVSLDGGNVALINSYLTINNHDSFGFALVVDFGPGPAKIYNNYIQGPGITMFWTDNVPTPTRADYEVRRNLIEGDEKYRKGGPASNGYFYVHRQPVEFKRGQRILFEGNTFSNWWMDEQIVGAMFEITTRALGNGPVTPPGEITDIMIRNNLFLHVVGGVHITSGDDQNHVRNTWATRRISILNNLWTNLDGYFTCTSATVGQCVNQGLGARGIPLRVSGSEDIVFEHNTVYKQQGSGPRLFNPVDNASEGLVYRNNIVWYQDDNGLGGLPYSATTSMTFPNGGPVPSREEDRLAGWSLRAPDPSYTFNRNVIPVCNNASTTVVWPRFPPENYWPGDCAAGETAVKFASASSASTEIRDFKLANMSPFRAGAANPASDGSDIGSNIFDLESSLGKVRNTRVIGVGETQAIISYTAPDAFACTVEASTNPGYTTSTRVSDGGGSRGRTVVINGLSVGALHYYRVLCASEQPGGTFTTQTGGGQATAITVLLAPPTGLPVTDAVIDYGATSALGVSTSAVSCATGCSVSVPAMPGEALFFRARYRAAGGTHLAQSSLQATVL